MTIRTSITHPLCLDPLPVGTQGGVLGITLCPGKHAPSYNGPAWARDLELDLDHIRHWGALAVLTLIEDHEFDALRVTGLGAGVRARGIDWHHLPITDGSTPDDRFEAGWSRIGPGLRDLLVGGGRAVVHCKGGLGRAGTIAARILIETGTTPAEAIRQVRGARGKDAIENARQERYVLALAPGARL